MKNILNKIILFSAVIFISSCELEEINNPNAPTYESFLNGATQADVRLVATGLEAIMRNDLSFHYQTVSILGREYYDLTGVDPRYTGELLKGPLDNNGFLTTRAFAAWYKIVQTANLLEIAVENSAAGFSNAEKDGYYGYAKTLEAYALLMVANRQYSNGIRLDVSDPNNPSDIVDYNTALTGIMTLLNEANTHLNSAPSEFDFVPSAGFSGFDTPSAFAEFNRAIAARVAIYQNDKTTALSTLNNSFMDLGGNLDDGPSHVFGLTGNDISNGQYYIKDQTGQEYMAHDTWVSDAEPNDSRVSSKVSLFGTGRQSFDNLSADYQVQLYTSNTDPIKLIRNEELILLYAEANIGSNNTEAINAINIIRNDAGIGDYTGGTTNADLENEILHQRRYSLFGEGHRWVDMRRYNRLSQIPTDRAGDNVLDAFPTPVTELN
ncbi:MAG: RagB/SusD family nutrient uptake outer membrane protein [Cyclobacteriaceae bacterium]|nr:RagB/SusD family nutrient uptake outer membrane protein [Cyclobacteriaceae bacterium]